MMASHDDKFILDACCGGRHMWRDKNNKNTVYMDIRQVEKGTIELQPNWSVQPDVIGDYRDMPFDDEAFRYVIWDIPHKIKHDNGIITMKYGYLGESWQHDLTVAFVEIMRVLKPQGMLIFKFNDLAIPFNEIRKCFPMQEIGFTPTKKGVNTTAFWCYIKPSKEAIQ